MDVHILNIKLKTEKYKAKIAIKDRQILKGGERKRHGRNFRKYSIDVVR
jgi:hypothetical protein